MDHQTQERLKAEAEFQNRRVEASHDGEAEARDRFYYLALRAMDRYHASFGDVTGKRVVVVGCSEGGVQVHAKKGAAEVIGIDIADVAVENLNEELRESGLADCARAQVMNGEDLDFEPGSVDLICCSGVLHHLDVERAAQSWARVLSPGGKVSMIEPMAFNPVVAAYRIATPSMRTDDEHPLTPKDFQILRRHFGQIDTQAFVLTSLFSLPFAWMSSGAKDLILPRLESFDDRLLRWFPALAYLCWTAVIELRDPRT